MDTLNNFFCFCGRHPLHFVEHTVTGFACTTSINCMFVPPRSPNLGEALLKSFIQTSISYNVTERVVLTCQGTTVLLVDFISQLNLMHIVSIPGL
jgi:hypothetical protein